jgi:hypothetical protein
MIFISAIQIAIPLWFIAIELRKINKGDNK